MMMPQNIAKNTEVFEFVHITGTYALDLSACVIGKL